MKSPQQRQYYNSRSCKYENEFFTPTIAASSMRFDKIMGLTTRIVNAAREGNILELGAGTGIYTKYLAKLPANQLVASDISQKMLTIAASKNSQRHIEFASFPAEKIPYSDSYFSLVAVFAAMHHFEKTMAVFAEIHRVLRQGGLFIMMEPNPLHPLNFILSILKPVERGMIKSWPWRWLHEADQTGFKVLNWRYGSFFPGWPTKSTVIYRKWEAVLEQIPVIKNLAIFGYYTWEKA